MKLLMMNPAPWAFSGTSVNLEDANVVVFGAPLEATVTFRPGTRFAPRAIREASAYIEFWSMHAQLDVEEHILFHDAGDILTTVPLEHVITYISEAIEYFAIKLGKPVAMLGGEHTVTLGVAKAMSSAPGKPLLVVFDAHLDLREEYEGRRLSHATVNARIAELLGGDRILVIGARAFSRRELERAKQVSLRYYTPLDLSNSSVAEEVLRLVDDADWIHISLDMDVFDPAFAPGVSNPEPEGLTPTQVLRLIERVTEKAVKAGKRVTMDVVEVSPPYDPSGITAVLAAKAVVEYAAGYAKARGARSG